MSDNKVLKNGAVTSILDNSFPPMRPTKPKKEYTLKRHTIDYGLAAQIWSAGKKFAAFVFVYVVGYLNLSVAWLITPVIMSIVRAQWKEESEFRRSLAKKTALKNEKEVVLARVDDLPSWVFFPDVDRAEWVNKILKQLWPNVNEYVKNLLKTKIEPKVAKKMKKFKLSNFHFDHVILGEMAPRVGGVKVYDKNIARNEIVMDVDLFYVGDCNITFSVNGLKGGINDFQLHGMLRIVMTPLIKKKPLIGGMQLFFLNNPQIDFDLVGICDILDMPGLGDMIRRIISEQLASKMVLPNKKTFKFSKLVESYLLKMPEPEGVLRVHVVEAKHLMKKDIGILGMGKSDPYAVLDIGAETFKTKVISNTVDPKWDYWFDCPIMDSSYQQIFAHLWDKDEGPLQDEILGRATIDVNTVVEKGQLDSWLSLEEVKHGMLHLRLTWLSLSENAEDLKKTLKETQELFVSDLNTALLTVYVDSASKLPSGKAKPDSYVHIACGSTSDQTEIVLRSEDPVWEHGFSFLIKNPETDTLYLKVVDHKSHEDIGEMMYNVANLLSRPNLEEIQQPYALRNSGPESEIVLSLKLKILKYPDEVQTPELQNGSSHGMIRSDSSISASSVVTLPSVRRQDSIKKQSSTESASGDSKDSMPFSRQTSLAGDVIEEHVQKKAYANNNEIPPSPGLRLRRQQSIKEESSLGKIYLTVQYSIQRQKLLVIVHKINNIPQKDPTNIPDPYVKLYLLPERHKDTKRKTCIVKDNCNPIFDETFEYTLSPEELKLKKLEVTVEQQKRLFQSQENMLGQVVIDLSKSDFTEPLTDWFELYPFSDYDHSKE